MIKQQNTQTILINCQINVMLDTSIKHENKNGFLNKLYMKI